MLVSILPLQVPRVTLKDLELPCTFPAAEVIRGVQRHSLAALGLFLDNETRAWDINKKPPTNWENTRVGSYTWRVRPSIYANKSGLVIDIECTRNQVLVQGGLEYSLRLKANRNLYVDETGKLLGESYKLDTPVGVWEAEAQYDEDTYTVTMTSPDKGKRKMGPVHPPGDMEEIRTGLFKPMWTEGPEPPVRVKTFRMLDPFTGALPEYKAEVSANFDGFIWNKPKKGFRFKISGGASPIEALVGVEGDFLYCKLEGYAFLMADSKVIG